jgi:hypothetical protein
MDWHSGRTWLLTRTSASGPRHIDLLLQQRDAPSLLVKLPDELAHHGHQANLQQNDERGERQ